MNKSKGVKFEPVAVAPPTQGATSAKRKLNHCPLVEFYSLLSMAYIVSKALKQPISIWQISGAARALNLRHDKTKVRTEVRGVIVFRQQTMIHKDQVRPIISYIEGKKYDNVTH